MSRYQIGDVVLVHWVYEEDGTLKVKPRLGIVYDIVSHEETVIIKCTSKNKSNQFPGIWVKKGSDEGIQMGLLKDTFIHVSEQLELHYRDVIRTIGKCPLMDEIRNILGYDL